MCVHLHIVHSCTNYNTVDAHGTTTVHVCLFPFLFAHHAWSLQVVGRKVDAEVVVLPGLVDDYNCEVEANAAYIPFTESCEMEGVYEEVDMPGTDTDLEVGLTAPQIPCRNYL